MQSGQTRCTERKGVQQRQKEVKEERAAGTCCCPLGHTLLHMCGDPSMLASPHTVTGPRTQSRLSSATVWLLTRRFVVIRKGKKKMLVGVVPGARGWSMGT